MIETQETAFNNALAELEQRVKTLEQTQKRSPDSNAMSIVAFSGELDKLLAAFVIATGAAACGKQVNMFFTFWATPALKVDGPQALGKSITERMFGWLLPGGFASQKLSKLNMFGIGRRMLCREMKKKNVASLQELIEAAQELAVQISVCEMSMALMGIHEEELITYPGLSFCGVARFVEQSSTSNTTLFI